MTPLSCCGRCGERLSPKRYVAFEISRLNAENELILLIFLDFHLPKSSPEQIPRTTADSPSAPYAISITGPAAGACSIGRRS
jgi:hypothetical protein